MTQQTFLWRRAGLPPHAAWDGRRAQQPLASHRAVHRNGAMSAGLTSRAGLVAAIEGSLRPFRGKKSIRIARKTQMHQQAYPKTPGPIQLLFIEDDMRPNRKAPLQGSSFPSKELMRYVQAGEMLEVTKVMTPLGFPTAGEGYWPSGVRRNR
jgi:hypothetical protein